MSGKTALITGITGQDGSYLAELLLEKGYTVYGLVRRVSQPSLGRNLINHLMSNDNFHLLNGDLADQNSIDNAVHQVKPDEFYNLGAMSFVPESWRSRLPETIENPTTCSLVLEFSLITKAHDVVLNSSHER